MVSFNTEVVIFFGTEINYLLSLKLSSLETCSVYLDSLCIESAVLPYHSKNGRGGAPRPPGETRFALSPAVCYVGIKMHKLDEHSSFNARCFPLICPPPFSNREFQIHP